MIGCKTGKILAVETRIKSCRICDYAKKHGIKVKDHKCCKIWTGSAKSMEAHMVVSMVKKTNSD